MKIKNTNIHYLESGKGDPIVFLHGEPTSSYLWRNIMPILADKAHCIAPDLVGMGKSDKPDIKYTFCEHIDFLTEFINNLNSNKVTLVLHGLLGSVIGFNYAMNHQDKIKAIAFYESYIYPIKDFKNFSLPLQHLLHPILNNHEFGYNLVIKDNYLLNKLLPLGAAQKFKPEALTEYMKPFSSETDRKPLWQYIQDFFLGENKEALQNSVCQYSEYLKQTQIPKLMFYTVPGFVTPMDTVQWCKNNLPNLQVADLEEGLYLAQETNPQFFGQILRDWYEKI